MGLFTNALLEPTVPNLEVDDFVFNPVNIYFQKNQWNKPQLANMSSSAAKETNQRFDFKPLKRPLITRAELEDLAKVRDQANAKVIDVYTVADLDGNRHRIHLGSLFSNRRYVIGYRSYLELCLLDFEDSLWTGSQVRCVACITSSPPLIKDDEYPEFEKLKPFLERWTGQWDNSAAKGGITSFLETHGKTMRQVDKVIGIGLGPPAEKLIDHLRVHPEATMRSDGEVTDGINTEESSFFQHLTLIHIADTLRRVQGNPDVKAYVQDPLYGKDSAKIFKEYLSGLDILDDPAAFCEMDRHTIGFFCHLSFDAGEIAIALAAPDGLAGMLCTPIKENHEEALLSGRLDSLLDSKEPKITLNRLNSRIKTEWSKGCEVHPIAAHKKWYGYKEGVDFYIKPRSQEDDDSDVASDFGDITLTTPSVSYTKSGPGTGSFDFQRATEPLITMDQLRSIKQECSNARAMAAPLDTDKYLHGKIDDYEAEVFLQKCGDQPAIKFRNKFELSLSYDDDLWEGPTSRNAAYIESSPVSPSEPLSLLKKVEPHLVRWKESFDAGKFKENSTKLIQGYGTAMREVKQVVGLGLGRPGSWTYIKRASEGKKVMDENETAFFRHLAILHVAEELGRVQGHAVKVYVQDPFYSTFSKRLIKECLPGIEIVEDPDAFLMLDENTFLFHCDTPFDASAIALSLTGTDRGLAGIMRAPFERNDEKKLTGAIIDSDTKPELLRRLVSSSLYLWSKICVNLDFATEKGWFGEGEELHIYYMGRVEEAEGGGE